MKIVFFAFGMFVHLTILAQVKSPATQLVLRRVIDDLANQARQCCWRGGVWKGCIQKLANKFHIWNQKWKAFGIPPDPAWD